MMRRAFCEIAAVVGLFAPWLTGKAAVLTPVAALGLCVGMAGAAVARASLREPRQVAVNLGLLGLAARRMTQLD